jgi:hypothetical protein
MPLDGIVLDVHAANSQTSQVTRHSLVSNMESQLHDDKPQELV